MTGNHQQKRLLSERFLRRCRLLDAARGILSKDQDLTKRRPLPAFALQANHGSVAFASPLEFHKTLCDEIKKAKERVYIASLYIGPAADPIKQPKELELLQALQSSSAPDIKIILDQNRALRPVPIPKNNNEKNNINNNSGQTTSSAKATAQAARNGNIHLFQVLPTPLASLLPNPLNEVAGVFHIKIYLIDDTLILSGANLSEEYFVDRQDRYFVVEKGGNGLVDFYAKLMNVLCNHAAVYSNHDGDDDKSNDNDDPSSTSREELLQELNQLFQDENPKSAEELLSNPDTVAVCIPTFLAPKGFWSTNDYGSRRSHNFVSDVDATLALLEEGATSTATVQLSSAYLNPTKDLVQRLRKYSQVDMITAGRMSHGFKPKPKAGNKGKDWIPTVFDHLQSDASEQLKQQHEATTTKNNNNDGSTTTSTIWHWERPDWTFHAKGIWLQQQQQQQQQQESMNDTTTSAAAAAAAGGGDIEAAIVGSSNFGGRSFLRDMESNLIMVFPDRPSIVADRLQDEWSEMLEQSKPVDAKELLESAPPLPIHIRSLLPYIKSFF